MLDGWEDESCVCKVGNPRHPSKMLIVRASIGEGSVTLYTIIKFVHVLMAITAVGSNITYGVWTAAASREPRHLAFALKGVRLLDRGLANPAYALLLITGVLMIYLGNLPWTTPWLLTAIVLYLALALIGLLAFAPALRRQIAVLESAGPDTAEYRALSRKSRQLGVLAVVIVAVIVFLMVAKPALWR